MPDPAEKKVILIVEDNDPLAQAICTLLNSEPGYSAVSVPEGQQALTLIHGLQANVILLDVGLPDMSGWQVYDALRADPATGHLPVIFVTGSQEREEFTRRGITHVLAKPFTLDDLLAEIASACAVERPDTAGVHAGGSAAESEDVGNIEYFLAVSG